MKVALAIYLFLLALEGCLAWYAGGSPFLLLALMAVVALYSLLSIRPGPAAGITRLIASALTLGLCPLLYANHQNVLGLCLLAMLHFFSATQCVWEVRQAGTTREVSSSKTKRAIFTLGFYATLGLAFSMLRVDFLELPRSTGIMLATIISLLGLIAWEVSRRGRFEKGKTSNTVSARGFLFRVAFAGFVAVMFALLFAVALPLASDALCNFSPELKSPRDLPDLSSGARQMPTTQSGMSGVAQSHEESASNTGPEMTSGTEQPRLPMRGTIELSDEIRVLIKFKNSAQAETLTKQGPLYVHTLAVSKFTDDQRAIESPSGSWVKDAMDGKQDGKVEVRKPLPGDIPHEVFIPQSTGDVLPALAGVTTYALPEVFVLPDTWFQSKITGSIRYKAWSTPVNILSISNLKIEPGRPGEAYLTKLDTPFGTRLTEIADFFRTRRTNLSGRLDLLQDYFQANFKYNLTVENKSGMPPLENFLFEEKSGHCELFAWAAALMLRHMGIPSRVAYGYKDGEHDAATDTWLFREYHAHAWTEIFVEDQGWVICDFTPFSSDSATRAATLPFDLTEFQDAGALSTEIENKLWNKAETLQTLQSVWGPTILGGGLLAAITHFLLLKRRTPAQRAAENAARERALRDRQPAYFIEFLHMCQALGHTRLEGQTLMEFHRCLKRAQICSDDFDDLVAYYYRSRYEDAPLDGPIEHGFLKHIQEFRNRWNQSLQSSLD